MMRRLLVALVLGAVLWLACLTSALYVPERQGECYLSAGWDGSRWHYGSYVCLEEALPALPDRRPEAPEPQVLDPITRWRMMDADLLADVALGEDPGALVAVMWTVLNRRRGDQLLEEVIWHHRAYGTVRGGRFWASWRRVPGSRWRRRPRTWARAVEAAWGVLLGLEPDPTRGATHFHRRGTWTPPWAPERTDWTLQGVHYFYEEGGTDGTL